MITHRAIGTDELNGVPPTVKPHFQHHLFITWDVWRDRQLTHEFHRGFAMLQFVEFHFVCLSVNDNTNNVFCLESTSGGLVLILATHGTRSRVSEYKR